MTFRTLFWKIAWPDSVAHYTPGCCGGHERETLCGLKIPEVAARVLRTEQPPVCSACIRALPGAFL